MSGHGVVRKASRTQKPDDNERQDNLEKFMKALLLAQIGDWKQKQQISLLDKAGFGQTEIADLLGSTSKAISVRLAEIRRESRSK
jgi:DNA-directed RNA polymerase specialized sigma24 family protein